MSAEEELEAAVGQAMRHYQVTCAEPTAFVDAIVYAAQRYAAGDSPVLAALRRRVLHRDSGPVRLPS